MSANDIRDFYYQCGELTDSEGVAAAVCGPFTQVSSVSLAGGRQPCAGYECRSKKLFELANYAALYADRIYIDNFLGLPPFSDDAAEVEAQYRFESDLKLMLMIRPLLQDGRIVPVTVKRDYCVHCLAKNAVGTKTKAKIDRAYRWLISRFQHETSVSLHYDDEEDVPFAEISGPDELIEHGGACLALYDPRLMPAAAELLAASTLSHVPVSGAGRKKLQMDAFLADEVLESIAFELNIAARLKATFVTDRSIHIQLLERISGDRELLRRNHILQRHLTSIVPFVNDVALDDLLRLRRNEADAFEAFRSSLNASVETYLRHRGKFSEEDAISLHADVIAPQLARLNQKVSVARRKITKAGTTKAAAWTGAIAFGWYSGFVPSELVAAANALGLTQVAANILETFGGRTSAEEEIRAEDMYFLWRVRHLSVS